MKNLKKLFFICVFGLGLTFFLSPSEADAACEGSYDVTYPTAFCDPQGFTSCTRKCPGDA